MKVRKDERVAIKKQRPLGLDRLESEIRANLTPMMSLTLLPADTTRWNGPDDTCWSASTVITTSGLCRRRLAAENRRYLGIARPGGRRDCRDAIAEPRAPYAIPAQPQSGRDGVSAPTRDHDRPRVCARVDAKANGLAAARHPSSWFKFQLVQPAGEQTLLRRPRHAPVARRC